MSRNTDSDKIAEFIAKRGVTRIAAGESALNYDRRDWRAVVRGEVPVSATRVKTDDELIREIHVRMVNGREYLYNGLGEPIAYDSH